MDKGLKLINELKEKRNDLSWKYLGNKSEIEYKEQNIVNKLFINKINNELSDLYEKKVDIENSSKLAKLIKGKETLMEIQRQIDEKLAALQDYKTKQKEHEDEIEALREQNRILDIEINKLDKQIEFIEGIRSQVIEDYCKNNPVLDGLLDKVFDEQIAPEYNGESETTENKKAMK